MKSRILAIVVVTMSATCSLAVVSLLPAPSPQNQRGATQDWPVNGGAPGNAHYSPLAQINRANVALCNVAWSFDTHEPGGLQTSPIIVDGVLYGITPTQKPFALDAATGKLLWKFDSGVTGTQPDRGLAYWSNENDKRILVGVMHFVYALDATTGKPIATFGKDGRIDLRENLSRIDPEPLHLSHQPGDRLQRSLHRRRTQRRNTSRAARRHSRLRRPHRQTPLDVPHHSATRRIRIRHLACGRLEIHRRRQQLGRHGPRRRTRHRLRPYRLRRFRFLWRRSHRRRSLRQLPHRARRSKPAKDSGISRAFATISGIAIFPPPPVLLTVKRDSHSVDAIAQTTKQGFVYLFDRTNGDSAFPDSSITNILRAPFPAKLPPPNNLFPPSPLLSPANSSPKTCSPIARLKLTTGPSSIFARSAAKANSFPSASASTP